MTESLTTNWNLADIYEAVAARVPDRACQIHGDRVVTWGEMDRRANAFGADLLSAGLGRQSKVANYLYNCPEYMEAMVGTFKVSAVPVNTNFRYGPEEILYLFDNADAEAVVFHASFTELLEGIRDRLPKVKRWYVVADEAGDGPDWATPYESVVAAGADAVRAPWPRSGDDLLLLYTGGTTGMPKGVMWRENDLVNVLGAGGNAVLGVPPATSVEEIAGRVGPDTPGHVMLVACPLMHGTGQFSAISTMIGGGAVVSLPNRRFDVAELFAEIQRLRVTVVIIVGQAFAGPMLAHLDANPGRYDLSSLVLMTSSGVMWSHDNKAGLIRHIPQVMLFDSYGSSEAVGLGGSVSSAASTEETARFALGPTCAVFTEDDRRVEPGSSERGMVGIGGFIPVGYYKDEVKSAQTFRVIDGQRWSIPGDFAEVNSDGSLHLLGRGSVCINTGGEKVFPEEVEEALKTHPSVRDVVAVGLPDERFGEIICAVVEPSPGTSPDLAALADHVKASLAAYKAPRDLVLVESIGRAANGKVDYKRLTSLAAERIGAR
ncbi:MAG: CoA synthetase, long-chain fatty acid:CoA ligase [Ilumatobacteraceae bacterium]|nr:CoA synthetase, long-chain fatty acid:CoA ligase [Ilumatobacteraceae bacterium]